LRYFRLTLVPHLSLELLEEKKNQASEGSKGTPYIKIKTMI